MMKAWILCGLVAVGVVACGGEGGETAGGTGGQAGASGGSGGSTAGKGNAGSAGTGGTSGGSGGTSSGGSAGAASGGSGGGGNGETPVGNVFTCFGDGCPLGECDDSQFFADELCSATYPGPIGASTAFCTTGDNAGYCLQMEDDFGEYWSVNCVGTTAVIEHCDSGCGVTGGVTASCS